MKRTYWWLLGLCVVGCAEVERDATVDDDTLAVIPVGPGTQRDVIIPPDTPVSEREDRPRQ